MSELEPWEEIYKLISAYWGQPPPTEQRGELPAGLLTNAPLHYRIHNYLKKQLQTYKEQNEETPESL